MNKKVFKIICFFIIFLSYFVYPVKATNEHLENFDIGLYEIILNKLNEEKYNDISDRDITYVITDEEFESIKSLTIGSEFEGQMVTTMRGIEKLTSLTSLRIRYQDITELDISKNIELKNLEVLNANNLKEIDFSKNINLENIDLTYTHLDKLNLENCSKLIALTMGGGDVNNASIKNLNLRNCINLKYLEIHGNKFFDVDLSGCPNIEKVIITDGTLKKIWLPKISLIRTLILSNNEIRNLEDIEELKGVMWLKVLYLQDNYIQDFSFLENIKAIDDLNIENNPKGVQVPINEDTYSNSKYKGYTLLEKDKSYSSYTTAGDKLLAYCCSFIILALFMWKSKLFELIKIVRKDYIEKRNQEPTDFITFIKEEFGPENAETQENFEEEDKDDPIKFK